MFGMPVLYGSPDMLDVLENSERDDRESYHRLKQKPLWKENDPELRSVFRNIRARVGNKKAFPLNRRGPSKKRFAADQEDCPEILNLQGKRRRRVANPDSLASALSASQAHANRPIIKNKAKCLNPEPEDVIIDCITVDDPDISKHYNTIHEQHKCDGFTTREKLKITPQLRNIHKQIISVFNGENISIPNRRPAGLYGRVGQGFYSGGLNKADTVGYYLTRVSGKLFLHYCFIKKEELFRLELLRNKPKDSTRCWQVVDALRNLHLTGIFGVQGTFNTKQLGRRSGLLRNNRNPYITNALECWCDKLNRVRSGFIFKLKAKYAKLVDDMSRPHQDDDDEHVDTNTC